MDLEGADDVPADILEVIHQVPLIDYAHEKKGIQRVFKLAEEGKCMTCEQPVGSHTTVVITPGGLTMLFCSTVCMTDLMVMQFIGELHVDINDRIEFRKAQSS